MSPTRTKADTADRRRPRYSLSRIMGIATVLFLVAVISTAVGDRDDWIVAFDQDMLDRIRWDGSARWLELVSLLGSTEFAVIVVGAVAVAVRRRMQWAAGWYAFAVFLGLATNVFLKEVISRPRPLGSMTATSLDSFPSGHMIQVTILATLLPMVLRLTALRPGVADAAVVILWSVVGAVGMARLLLGAHWPSDILAGAYIGFLVALVVAPQLRRTRAEPLNPGG